MAQKASDQARAWAASAIQHPAARTAVKRGVYGVAAVRGRALAASGRLPEIQNIFCASSPKAGSQWLKAIFDHPVVKEHTHLMTLPQFDHQTRLHKTFPPGTFVPGVYMSYPEYQSLNRPYPHRTIYVYRDPRDVVVSGYYSAVFTHPSLHDDELEGFRQRLRDLPRDEAILELIHHSTVRLQEITSWAGVSDPLIHTLKLEDNKHDEIGQIRGMLEHCEVHLSESEFDQLANTVTRAALQRRDLAQRESGGESHYRVSREGYREIFNREHYEAMESIIPGFAAQLGYPESPTL